MMDFRGQFQTDAAVPTGVATQCQMTFSIFKALAATVVAFVQYPGESFLRGRSCELHGFPRSELVALAVRYQLQLEEILYHYN